MWSARWQPLVCATPEGIDLDTWSLRHIILAMLLGTQLEYGKKHSFSEAQVWGGRQQPLVFERHLGASIWTPENSILPVGWEEQV